MDEFVNGIVISS